MPSTGAISSRECRRSSQCARDLPSTSRERWVRVTAPCVPGCHRGGRRRKGGDRDSRRPGSPRPQHAGAYARQHCGSGRRQAETGWATMTRKQLAISRSPRRRRPGVRSAAQDGKQEAVPSASPSGPAQGGPAPRPGYAERARGAASAANRRAWAGCMPTPGCHVAHPNRRCTTRHRDSGLMGVATRCRPPSK